MPIRYKVIRSRTRTSAIVGTKYYGKFCLTYKKGTIVTAPKDSIGIITSQTRRKAERWITKGGQFHVDVPLTIIKVRGIGKAIRIKDFHGKCHLEHILDISKIISTLGVRKALSKLIGFGNRLDIFCYKSVDVLE